MQTINIINPSIDSVEKLRDLLLKAAFPNASVSPDPEGGFGLLYKAFATKLYQVIDEMNDVINDWYDVSIDNLDNRLLDNFCQAYGLPDLLFNKLETNLEKTLAIIIRRFILKCKSAENFEEMFRMLGIEVKIECKSTEAKYFNFPAKFPCRFGGFQPKFKNTFIVYVKNNNTGLPNFGPNHPFPMKLSGLSDNLNKVKFILENYLKIVDKVFQYKSL
jgi:hypothetical protein